ncbi:MAG: gamma-glutamyl-gamma-aminobutyrate hydrolase family protein [Pseudomonadota bacterium]
MSSRPTRPRIGLTLDAEPPGGFSALPWYAIRENYCTAISRAGGLPIALPHEVELAEDYVDLLDGLVVTGGAFDVDPSLYGAADRHDTVVTKDRRTAFELAVLNGFLKADRPVLGICGGQQLLNVTLGGTLIQHIPDEVTDCLAHEQPNPRTEPGHEVAVAADTLLHRLGGGADTLSVNSAHHQAAGVVGDGVVISGYAPDGVIEAIELPEKRFCLGVQWHPEYSISAADDAIFRAMIEASQVETR